MTNLFTLPLAYKLVMIQLMVAEANFFAEKLELPETKPMVPQKMEKIAVVPPGIGFGGVVDSGVYFYSFLEHGKLWLVQKDDTVMKHGDRWKELKNAPSLVDTNGAYQLAKIWLAAVSVDVEALEKKYHPRIWQFEFYNTVLTGEPLDREKTPKSKLPVYHVGWGEGNDPPVEVVLLGTTKELMRLRMLDISFSRRPPLVITNLSVLMDPANPTNRLTNAPLKQPVAASTNTPTESLENKKAP